MAGQYPSAGYVADSQTVLLRKICYNTAQIVDTGGGGGGVTRIIAGSGIAVSPVGGTGDVTVSATGGAAGNAYAAATNNAGNTTITPTKATETRLITFTGAASARILILDVTGRTAGDKLFLDLIFPATSGLVISARNATAGGTLLLPVESFGGGQTFTTDGNVLSAHWEFTYTGTAWIYDMSNLPA
jgi:hypothetical protein